VDEGRRGAGGHARDIRPGIGGQAPGSPAVVKGPVISINWHVPRALRLAQGHPKRKRRKKSPGNPLSHDVSSVSSGGASENALKTSHRPRKKGAESML